MVTCLGSCERQHGRGEEHGLVIGVGDQETYSFVLERRKS